MSARECTRRFKTPAPSVLNLQSHRPSRNVPSQNTRVCEQRAAGPAALRTDASRKTYAQPALGRYQNLRASLITALFCSETSSLATGTARGSRALPKGSSFEKNPFTLS